MNLFVAFGSGGIKIDGKAYQFMGTPFQTLEDMNQTSLEVYPTQTRYTFEESGVQLNVTFSTPAFADNLTSLALPYTYITFEMRSLDSRVHDIQLYYDNSAEHVVTSVDEQVTWSQNKSQSSTVLTFGTTRQHDLGQTTDMIDWGYLYVSALNERGMMSTITSATEARTSFVSNQPLPPMDTNKPRCVRVFLSSCMCLFF